MNENHCSRRTFIKLGASAGVLSSLGQLSLEAQAQDYKALVCVFMFGGNDGFNTVVPATAGEYSAYSNIRGSLALTSSQLLPITTVNGGQYALHPGLLEMQPLFQTGKLAVVANTGILNQPTTQAQYEQSLVPLPAQLFSHSDQITEMQSGAPGGSFGTGWGGRVLDLLQSNNANAVGPVSISFNGSSLYCAGQVVSGTNLQPGNNLTQDAMNSGWPQSVIDAFTAGQRQIIGLTNGRRVVAAADKVFGDALQLNALLTTLPNGGFQTQFPNTGIGEQLENVARFISVRAQTAVGRQIFFCGLGSFDTHSDQLATQSDLFQQASQAMKAFYDATVELSVDRQVTTFTLSDFGRTFEPSGSGTDHGWGNHLLVLGGAVKGQRIHGQFPILNPSNPAYDPNAFADNRGVMLPTTSLAQFGATLATWMGASDPQLNGLFPELANFQVRNLGFMA